MMPKHHLLSMTLRHIGSAEIISLIQHFGHCASYTSLLELETTKVQSLTHTIDPDRNIVTHFVGIILIYLRKHCLALEQPIPPMG